MLALSLGNLLRQVVEIKTGKYVRLLTFDNHTVIRTSRRAGADPKRLSRHIRSGSEVLHKNRFRLAVKQHLPGAAPRSVAPRCQPYSSLSQDKSHSKMRNHQS